MINDLLRNQIRFTTLNKIRLLQSLLRNLSRRIHFMLLKTAENKKIDQIISKKIMFHLQDFFKGSHSPKTVKKRRSKRKNKRKRTHKIR